MSKDNKSLRITGPYGEFSFKLMRDDRLTWAEKSYYVALLDRATFEDQGWSFQTHETMEAHYGFSVRYSKTLSKSLYTKGFIEKKKSKNGFISIPLERYNKTIDKARVDEDPGVYMKVRKS